MSKKSTQELLDNARQKVALAKKQLTQESERERKKLTRAKIELGGLIVKARLSSLSRTAILGILLEAKEKLDGNRADEDHRKWVERGRSEFDKG